MQANEWIQKTSSSVSQHRLRQTKMIYFKWKLKVKQRISRLKPTALENIAKRTLSRTHESPREGRVDGISWINWAWEEAMGSRGWKMRTGWLSWVMIEVEGQWNRYLTEGERIHTEGKHTIRNCILQTKILNHFLLFCLLENCYSLL